MTPEFIDQLAEEILRSAGQQVPVDVEQVARRLGVTELRFENDLLEDGRLERSADGPRVIVRSSARRERMRFTVAHELGHLVFSDPGQRVAFRGGVFVDDHAEEHACNVFAAALLLPRRWVESLAGGKPQELRTLEHVKEAAGVSWATALIRLREVCAWTASLVWWERRHDGWVALGATATPSAWHLERRRLTGESSGLLDATRGQRDTVVAQLEVRCDSDVERWRASTRVYRRKAVSLLLEPSQVSTASP